MFDKSYPDCRIIFLPKTILEDIHDDILNQPYHPDQSKGASVPVIVDTLFSQGGQYLEDCLYLNHLNQSIYDSLVSDDGRKLFQDFTLVYGQQHLDTHISTQLSEEQRDTYEKYNTNVIGKKAEDTTHPRFYDLKSLLYIEPYHFDKRHLILYMQVNEEPTASLAFDKVHYLEEKVLGMLDKVVDTVKPFFTFERIAKTNLFRQWLAKGRGFTRAIVSYQQNQ